MTWVRKQEKQPPPHLDCELPPVTEHRDLWRCDVCFKLWRVAFACEECDDIGLHKHKGFTFDHGNRSWKPAGPWLNWKHRRAGYPERKK